MALESPTFDPQSVTLEYSTGQNVVVRVKPGDRSRFKVQRTRARQALRIMESQVRTFQEQFRLLLETLAKWISERREKIDRAIVTLQDGNLMFVIVRVEARYDEAFQDAVSALELGIANDPGLDLIELNTICLPSVSGQALRSFVDQRMSLEYGKRN